MTILPKGEILGGVQSGQLEMATLGLFFVATCGPCTFPNFLNLEDTIK